MLARALRRWNHYEVLGVSLDANQLQIKQAFYRLAKKYHPDASSERTSEKFKEVTEAYKVLSDSDLRQVYDRKLSNEQARAKKSSQKPASSAATPEEPFGDPDESPYTKAYTNFYDTAKRSELREARMQTGEHLKDPMYKKSIRDFGRDASFTMLLVTVAITAAVSPFLIRYGSKADRELSRQLLEELDQVQKEQNRRVNIEKDK